MYNPTLVTAPAAEMRLEAREALDGKRSLAFRAGALFTILTTVVMTILSVFLSTATSPASTQNGITLSDNMQPTFSFYSGGSSAVSWLYVILVGGAFTLGFATIVLKILRREETDAKTLFSGFNNFLLSFALYVLQSIFIFLWTLLFIIPGIIAAYRYSMAFFILHDNPKIGPLEALRQSKEMMRGNKWKLFCLQISFVGWWALVIFGMFVVMVITILVGSMAFDFSLFNPEETNPSAMVIMAENIVFVIVLTAFALISGYLTTYVEVATAAFYEKAGGLRAKELPRG
jgi:uncharacterized membrane protein